MANSITHEAVELACILMLAAVNDTVGITEKQMIAAYETANRYGDYLDQNIAKVTDVLDSIERHTGRRIEIKYLNKRYNDLLSR